MRGQKCTNRYQRRQVLLLERCPGSKAYSVVRRCVVSPHIVAFKGTNIGLSTKKPPRGGLSRRGRVISGFGGAALCSAMPLTGPFARRALFKRLLVLSLLSRFCINAMPINSLLQIVQMIISDKISSLLKSAPANLRL